MQSLFQFNRWAERKGRTVKWGNLVGPYRGQEFRETFKTEAQAKERERQAIAKEAISKDRKPIPLRRKQLHPL